VNADSIAGQYLARSSLSGGFSGQLEHPREFRILQVCSVVNMRNYVVLQSRTSEYHSKDLLRIFGVKWTRQRIPDHSARDNDLECSVVKLP